MDPEQPPAPRPARQIESTLNLADARELLAQTVLCVLVHDADSKDILWANSAACTLLEFTVDELRPLKAHHMSASSAQYHRSIGRAWLQEAAESGESRMVWRYRSKSGREIATDALARRVELCDGPAVMVQFRDIERELEMQASLARSEALFQALARHSVTGVVVLDTDQRIEFATAAAIRLLDSPTVVGRLFTDLVYPHDTSFIGDEDATEPEAERSTTIRVRVLSTGRWLGGTRETLLTETSAQQVITLHDITELRAAEMRRARLADYENYLARYNAMGDLALTVTHELAQPLSAASNFIAGTISRAERAGQPGIQDGLVNARKQIERAREVLTSLRDFVAEQEHHTRRMDLNEVVEESLYFVRIRAEEAGVNLTVELSRTPLLVECEAVLTGQVVLNLCINGIDEIAGRNDALIVRTRQSRDRAGNPVALFEVEDHGRGIPAEQAARLFEAGITHKEHGSGIGLALSRQVIVRQRGDIKVVPARPSGAVFVFSLPLAR